MHEGGDFRRGRLPVIGGEGEEGEDPDAGAGRRFDDAAHGFDSGAMAGHARQAAGGGPAAIAIHDDTDVQSTLQL